MSATAGALSARNVILAAGLLLTVALVWMAATIRRPKDSGGLGRDSYGTRTEGHRALYELLEELGVTVARSTAPPPDHLPVDATLALIAPHNGLVQTGPKYLQAAQAWVEQGGRLVVAPTVREPRWSRNLRSLGDPLAGTPDDVLDALDLDDLVTVDDRAGFRIDGPDGAPAVDEEKFEDAQDDDWADMLPEEIGAAWRTEAPTTELWPIVARGRFAGLAQDAARLALPADGFAALEVEPEKLAGSLACRAPDGTELVLAAALRRGQGEIIVLAEPLLLANAWLPQADNSVLAARLLAADRQAVVFDEFYHGLAIRGNPFYLLTYPAFATIALVGLAGIIAWAWRSAVFLGPPLPSVEPTRRTLGEYVDAMARFLARGAESRRFLVEEVRDGVLRELCRRLRLPLETAEPVRIVAKLEARDPQRAARLQQALADVDRRLAAAGDYPRRSFLTDVQRLTACL